MDEADETIQTQGGVLLAHTALFGAVLGLFREKGLITQADVNAAIDNALIGVETSPTITPGTTLEARVLLERLAGEMAGPRGLAGD
jgi:hypothetical protein